MTDKPKVISINTAGIQIHVNGQELFLSFLFFPLFKKASVMDVFNVELSSPGHIHWPKLNIELNIDSILDQDIYPIASQTRLKARY